MRKLLWILTIFVTAIACNQSSNFSINGTVTNSNSDMIYLEQLGISGTIPFDSSKIKSDGSFELKGSVSYPTFFLLKLNNQKFITLLVDSLEKINFSADYINFTKDYKVDGSLGSEKVKLLNNNLAQTNHQLDSIKSLLALLVDENSSQTQKSIWLKEMNGIYTKQQEFSKKFIDENPFSLASVLAIYQKFNNGNYIVQDLQTLKMSASALHSMYPNSVHAQTLYKDTEKLVQDIRKQEINQFIDQYGTNSPEITLPNTKGKDVSLSSLKGKVVLIQFWSAIDRPSRILNTVLRENYKQFKKKGFEIYQVSIDTNKETWLKAIEQDKMNWINVGDMEGSVSAVNNFNISSIPSNYLLDQEGNIIARNIKGPEINRKLNEILN